MRTILVGVFALALSLPSFSAAATLTECQKISPLHRPATTEDAVVKNGTVPVGDCYNPTTMGINQEAEEAKRYLLETRNACSGGQGISGEDPKNCILRLDAAFAISLAKMFKENPGVFGGIKILSGYRTAEGERKVSGKDTGNHRRGCAVDLTGPNSSNTACLGACQFIKANSARLKLAIPYFYSPEYNHVEPVGSCSGGQGASPNPDTGARAPSSNAPSSVLSDAIRQSLGYQQPLVQQQPFVAQPYAQAQPVLNTFGMPSPVTPVAGITPTTGVGATAVAPSSTDPQPMTPIGGVSEKLFGNIETTKATGSPLAKKLEELAFGVSTGSATSGLPFIPLLVNPDDRSDRAATTTETAPIAATRTPSVTTDTTFFDTDFNSYPTPQTAVSQQGFAQALASIRAILVNLLARLRPFASHGNIGTENQI